MTTKNFIEESGDRLIAAIPSIAQFTPVQINILGNKAKEFMRTELQSFARKVVEEIEELPVTKVSGQWLTRHDAVVESVLRLSGLSGSYSDRVAGEDNQHKE